MLREVVTAFLRDPKQLAPLDRKAFLRQAKRDEVIVGGVAPLGYLERRRDSVAAPPRKAGLAGAAPGL